MHLIRILTDDTHFFCHFPQALHENTKVAMFSSTDGGRPLLRSEQPFYTHIGFENLG
jgi:hypothetical protein